MSKQEHNTVILLKGDLEHALGMEHTDIEGMWDEAAKGEIDRSASAYEGIVARVALAAGDKGKSLDASAVKAMVKKCMLPIAEVKQAQVLAWRVSDDVGFACRGLADLETDVGGDEDTEGLGEQGAKKKDVEVVRSPLSISTDVMPGLSVLDGGDREYPIESAKVLVEMSTLPGPLKQEGHKEIVVDGLGAHVLGRIRDRVQREDPQRREEYLRSDAKAWYEAMGEPLTAESRYDPTRDRGGYHESDRVGDTGIEASQENVLRGLRGMQTSRLDNGEMVFESPAVGQDVHLTIDMMLEARVQAAMSPALGLAVVQDWQRNAATLRTLPVGAPAVGSALNGAAVVLDIDSGDILAMVSMPSYSREQAKEAPETVYKDPLNVPFLNRAIAKPYQPGSIVKPLILNGAVRRGNYSLDERIACTGYLFPNYPKMYRCWIYKEYTTTHSARFGHDLSGSDAIMVSCNIFFFTMGKRLGVDGMATPSPALGVGHRFNGGVGQEFAGSLGRGPDGAKMGLQDAIMMGIGQGAGELDAPARRGGVCHAGAGGREDHAAVDRWGEAAGPGGHRAEPGGGGRGVGRAAPLGERRWGDGQSPDD